MSYLGPTTPNRPYLGWFKDLGDLQTVRVCTGCRFARWQHY